MFTLLLSAFWLTSAQSATPYPSTETVDAAWKRVREAEAPYVGLVKNDRIKIHWIDADRLWYRADRDGRTEFVLANAAKGTKGPAFDHARLAAELSKATGAKLEASNLKLEGLTFGTNDTLTGLTCEGKRYIRDENGWKQGGTNPAENPKDRLQPVAGRARSGGSGPETSILFDNQLKQPVEIFWVAGDGSAKSYGPVPPGKTRDQHTFAGHVWSVRLSGRDLGSYRATENPGRVVIDSDQPQRPRRENGTGEGRPRGATPSGSLFTRDHNLFQKGPDGSEKQLTTDGTAKDGYRGAVFIAPGGKRAIAMRTMAGDARKLTLIEAAPKDQLQPKVTTVDYPKPGDAIDCDMPRLFDLENNREIPLDEIGRAHV